MPDSRVRTRARCQNAKCVNKKNRDVQVPKVPVLAKFHQARVKKKLESSSVQGSGAGDEIKKGSSGEVLICP